MFYYSICVREVHSDADMEEGNTAEQGTDGSLRSSCSSSFTGVSIMLALFHITQTMFLFSCIGVGG